MEVCFIQHAFVVRILITKFIFISKKETFVRSINMQAPHIVIKVFTTDRVKRGLSCVPLASCVV